MTLDVVGLYSNIPHHEVTTSLMETQTGNDHLKTQAPLTHIVETVEHILHKNVFELDRQIFGQISRTAMGMPMVPSVANVFMGWPEQLLSW